MSTSNCTATNPRRERGEVIAATLPIRQDDGLWIVPSQSGKGQYTVRMDGDRHACNCPDFTFRHVECKHVIAVQLVIERETHADGSVTETVTQTVTETKQVKQTRRTYPQNWPAYNAAQMHELERFLELLRGLCDGIPQPPQTKGRPRLPLADVVFALGVKTYSTVSGRRATGYIEDALSRGLMEKSPHYNSAFRTLESPELTDLLKGLIEESAKPLKAVEVDFAVDSTGFATCTYQRWFDHKWGKERSRQEWVKAHIITGVTTNVITSVEATAYESADAPQLPALVNRTAETFAMREVSGDKAYSSRANLRAIEAVGASAYIPFKKGTTGQGHGFDALWSRMWHFYMFNQDAFLAHYHKRSNVETTMSMIKAKFGASVRAKSPTAQVNEVLLKCLCHNVVVLVQSIYELGLEPTFWTDAVAV
jgi:transposase